MLLVLHKKWRQPEYPKSLKILSIEIKMEALKKDKEITKTCQRMAADVQNFLSELTENHQRWLCLYSLSYHLKKMIIF